MSNNRLHVISLRNKFGVNRTACDCSECVAQCQHAPGFLTPDDLTRMIPSHVSPLDWASENLRASRGALVLINGETQRIPTLVMAHREDGSCVKLVQGKCAVHSVAPFGCAFFDCKTPEEQSTPLAATGLHEVYLAMSGETLYRRIWDYLNRAGLVARPLAVRKENLHDAINALARTAEARRRSKRKKR